MPSPTKQKKVIHEKMDEDPAFYEKFSKLIQQAIDAFKARRLSALDYLKEPLINYLGCYCYVA